MENPERVYLSYEIVFYYDRRYGVPQLGLSIVNEADREDFAFFPNHAFEDAMDEMGIRSIEAIAGFSGGIPLVLAN